MRVTTALNRLLQVPGASVCSVSFLTRGWWWASGGGRGDWSTHHRSSHRRIPSTGTSPPTVGLGH